MSDTRQPTPMGEPPPQPGSRRSPPRQTRPPLSVLFVDPDTVAAQRLARALPNAGAVTFAATARAALDIMRTRMPDLIVTEMLLPDTTGAEFIAYVHSQAATQQVLLLVTTTQNAVAAKIAAFQAGADDFLVKPVEPEVFALHVQLVSKFRKTTRN